MIKKIKSVTSRLPSEYQEVKYIESTGSQYIDAGFMATPNTMVSIDFQLTNLVKDQRLFGRYMSNTVSGDLSYDMYISSALNLAYTYNNNVGNWMGIQPANTQKHHVVFNQNKKIIIDGTEFEMVGSATNSCKRNFLIFNAYDGGTSSPTAYSQMRLYSLKIYESDTQIRDFVPCYRKSDKAIGLYDLINSVFYVNSGSGTFGMGEKIEEENLKPFLGNKKVVKKYVGEKVVYTEINYKDTQFAASPFPTMWSYRTNNVWFAENTYGSWYALCTTTNSTGSHRCR